jgi:hypothetical protein
MAFLKRKHSPSGTYLYVVQSYRTPEGKVRENVLQYLGNEKGVSSADAAEAVAHWNKWIKQRKARKGGRVDG